jgi:hypothetical protein
MVMRVPLLNPNVSTVVNSDVDTVAMTVIHNATNRLRPSAAWPSEITLRLVL